MNFLTSTINALKIDAFKQKLAEHLGGTPPHEVLGVRRGISQREIQKAYMKQRPNLAQQANTPEGAKALQRFDLAYQVTTDRQANAVYEHWRQEAAASATPSRTAKIIPLNEEGRKHLEDLSKNTGKLAISKPMIAMGATAIAATGVAVGMRASERIKADRENGNTPHAKDMLLKTAGYATAAATIATAALMWRSGKAR